MEEVEKYKLIQSCENIDQLKDAMDKIGPVTFRTESVNSPEKMKLLIDIAYKTGPINVLTRNYGIRQQLLYILYYEKMEDLKNDIERQITYN